ncbi:hypothetical protein GTP91_08875, partial [Rugamonas sp. FT82W]|nr:hypothetical protein [Duganella vulcania]
MKRSTHRRHAPDGPAAQLRAMRRRATGLLVLMAVLFACARLLQPR